MKLYTSVGPNPHVVILFLKEKGLQIETETIDIRGGDNRREPYLSTVNSRGQCPVLVTDDGQHLTEITAICEYLEEKHPEPALIGTTAAERAETRMWVRRIDLGIIEPMANGYRASEGYDMFKDRYRVLPEAADGLKAVAQDNLKILNDEIDGKQFICGDKFTLADIMFYAFITFGTKVGQPVNPEFSNVANLIERIAARVSTKK